MSTEGNSSSVPPQAVAGTAASGTAAPGTAAAVSGRVHSVQQPLSGVTLTLTDRVGAQVARGRTGSDGRFRLTGPAPGSYVLIFSRAGYRPHASVVLLDAGPVTPLDVPLDPVAGVRGTVRDRHTGEPMATAAVTVLGPDGEVIAGTVSDPDGGYRLTGIDAAEVTLVAAAPAADPVARAVALGGDDTGPEHVVDLVLDTYSTLTGTVTDRGRAAAHLPLALRDHTGRTVGTTVTDEGGTYRFTEVRAGRYTLTSAVARPQLTAIAADATTADISLSSPSSPSSAPSPSSASG